MTKRNVNGFIETRKSFCRHTVFLFINLIMIAFILPSVSSTCRLDHLLATFVDHVQPAEDEQEQANETSLKIGDYLFGQQASVVDRLVAAEWNNRRGLC